MGVQQVSVVKGEEQMHRFVHNLLRDVQALEYMLNNNWFETETIRIGAEQEMCLVDRQSYKPATVCMEALDGMQDLDWIGTELAKFNLESNMTPHVFKGDCLRKMEDELTMQLRTVDERVAHLGAEYILTGILPTLRKFDLDLSNLTPNPRYFALIEAIKNHQRNQAFELRLAGIDELLVKHDSPLMEACNTSFQVHLQVTPDEFVQMYNISLALAAPVMAIAANSPLVFGRRLWHETRIALFQQALDTRSTLEHMRERSPRVSFGQGWLRGSILDIYKEDIARFRVLLAGDDREDSFAEINAGRVPKLRALQVHNSTVYRWNRPCYGISDNGQPHLRIENRVLPAGPTIVDEVANAAFWLGLMKGMALQYGDITQHISFDDVRDNFGKAARFGIDTKFTWFNDRKVTAVELVSKELLPIARAGLESQGVDSADIDRYLGIIGARADHHMNGARWMLRAFTKLAKETSRDEAVTAVTAAIINNQKKGDPVHTWKMPELSDLIAYSPTTLRVEEVMETDLFTVQKDDIIELVADLMDWRRIRYTPVEDEAGNLVGLVTSRLLLRHFTARAKGLLQDKPDVFVRDIMVQTPITVAPDALLLDALNLMKERQIGCLPVVKGTELVGIITEMEFLRISGRLLKRMAGKG